MESRLLLICLATSLLSSILLFIYFKNRISSVEEKVNVIFQLVQNHEQENKIMMHETVPTNSQQYMPTDNLIVVSENEEESDSDDSEEESDSDNDNSVEDGLNLDSDLVISENIIDENEIKKIALNLEDNLEEVEDIVFTKENVEELESNSEDDDDEDDDQDNSVENEIKQTINYSKYKVDQLRRMCQDKELENYSKLKKAELIKLLENS